VRLTVDPGIAAAVVAGVVAIVTASLGFRSKREETATAALTALIGGLQAEVTRQGAVIIAMGDKQDRLELLVEQKDTTIGELRGKLKAVEAVKDAEIERLLLLVNSHAARVVDVEVSSGLSKAATALEVIAWDEADGAGM
jgi:hypothetical protein